MPALYRAVDDDPIDRSEAEHCNMRTVFQRRINALIAKGVDPERAKDAVLGPAPSPWRVWFGGE